MLIDFFIEHALEMLGKQQQSRVVDFVDQFLSLNLREMLAFVKKRNGSFSYFYSVFGEKKIPCKWLVAVDFVYWEFVSGRLPGLHETPSQCDYCKLFYRQLADEHLKFKGIPSTINKISLDILYPQGSEWPELNLSANGVGTQTSSVTRTVFADVLEDLKSKEDFFHLYEFIMDQIEKDSHDVVRAHLSIFANYLRLIFCYMIRRALCEADPTKSAKMFYLVQQDIELVKFKSSVQSSPPQSPSPSLSSQPSLSRSSSVSSYYGSVISLPSRRFSLLSSPASTPLLSRQSSISSSTASTRVPLSSTLSSMTSASPLFRSISVSATPRHPQSNRPPSLMIPPRSFSVSFSPGSTPIIDQTNEKLEGFRNSIYGLMDMINEEETP